MENRFRWQQYGSTLTINGEAFNAESELTLPT